MLPSAMMPSPSGTVRGKHRIIATKGSNIISPETSFNDDGFT